MPDVTEAREPIRSSLLALIQDLDALTHARYWSALSSEERRSAVVSIVECQCGADHSRFYASLANVLRMRVQTLKQRPADAAAQLDRRSLPPHLVGMLVLHLLTDVLAEEFEAFVSILRAGENDEEEQTVVMPGGIRVNPDRVPLAAMHLMGAFPPNRALALVVGLYLEKKALRSAIAEWLLSVSERPVEELLDEAQALQDALEALEEEQEDNEADDAEYQTERESVATCRSEATQLAVELESLASLLREAGEQASAGVLPAEEVKDTLVELRKRFYQFEERIRDTLVGEFGLSMEAPKEPLSMQNLERLLNQWQEQEEAASVEGQMEDARLVLQRALQIRVQDEAAIRPAHEDARRTLEVLDAGGDAAVALAQEIRSEDHPLNLLCAVVYQTRDLDDADKVAAGNRIGASYGVPLAMEMAFGRLRVEEDGGEEAPTSGVDGEPTGEAPPAESDAAAEPAETEAAAADVPEKGDPQAEAPGLDAPAVGGAPVAASEEDLAPTSPADAAAAESSPMRGEPNAEEVQDPTSRDRSPDEGGAKEESPEVLAWTPSGMTLVQLAGSFPDAEPDRQAALAQAIVYKLIRRGNRGMAAYVGSWLQETHPEVTPEIPLWLLRALALSPSVSHAVSETAYALRDNFASFSDPLLEGEESTLNQTRALLLASAAIRPALLAPTTLASGPLSRAKSYLGKLEQFWEYCQSIAAFSTRGVALDSSVLKGVRGQATWEAEVADLLERTEQWSAHAPRMSLKFAPATRIWMKWQEQGGVIQSLLEPVRRNDRQRLEFVRTEIERLSDPQEIRRLVDHTDRHIIERRVGDPVNFKAYNQFSARVREALGLAREWVGLQDDAPGEASSYRVEQADRVRKELLTRHKAVLEELDQFADTVTASPLRTAIVCVREAVQDLDALFSGTNPIVREEVSPARALNADLLRVPGIDLSDAWTLDSEDTEATMRAILAALAAGDLPSWMETFRMRTGQGDHTGGALVLSHLEAAQSTNEEELDEMHRLRLRALAEDRAVVRRVAVATERQVDQAVMFGIIGESERETLMDRVRSVAQSLESTDSLHQLRNALAEASEQIQARRGELARELEEEMLRVGIDAFHLAYPRITSVLERGDLLTAREYIHHVERGNSIREEEEDSGVFAEFFPFAVLDLERYRLSNPNQLLDSLRESRPFSCVDMTLVSEPQARQAAEAMAAWFRARMRKNTPENEVARAIFSFLGFNVIDVTTQQVKGKGSRVWSEIYTEPVKDRTRCPVAHYGSIAAGGFNSDRARYRVLWQWDEPSPEDLIGAVGETSQEAPTFVFYFGKLSEERRRSLARLSRRDKRTFLVIDDILLLYLCGVPAARMPVMFECALPFTYLEPYVTTASLVPPEVFYGREEDRNSIMNVHGSCFIYGGRQLGKTALLRDVERRFNDPDAGRVALYVDLKGEGIGFNRPVEDLWPLLAEKFKSIGVLPTSLSSHVNPEKILGEVRKWVESDMRRRILLLLDETDRFLEGDRDFVQIARLKNEMEATGRRFKVVFAGLHNVQRTTRLGNNPLAHLGEPRCIGPLFENMEWREARDLVQEPLGAIGYRFESEDLVVRILSQTNYYPSLLQLYCTQLLRHVNRPNVELFDSRSGPPYVITSKHVEDAYQSQELWQRIRERFNWTLDLDPRYRLIALLIAHYTSGETPEQYRDGFSSSQIRGLALRWWARGFTEDRSEESFSALLDEMVGLGILRQTEGGRYRMRTGNVTLLLGTPEEIDSALLTVSSQEPPRPYEAQTFRRPLVRAMAPETGHSPLTAQQESLLQKRENGVLVVFGSGAAGIDDLPATLPEVMGENFLISLCDLTDRGQFKRELDGLKARAKDGVTLVVVEPSCLWSEFWVRDAAEKVAALKSKQNFVRVLFIADPEKAWQLVHSGLPAWEQLASQRKITTFTLRPWHGTTTRAWLDEQRVPATLMETYLQEFQTRTGAWPALLYELMGSLTANAPGRWRSEWVRFMETWENPERLRARKRAFGFSFPGPGSVATLLAMGAASAEDLAAVSGIPLVNVEEELRWLDLLGFASPTEEGTWRLDGTIQRLLSASESYDRLLVESAGA